MNQEARDKIIKARVTLQKTHPFFSYLALHLTPIEVEAKVVPTLGVDARGNLYYNPEFVNKMAQDKVKGVVCHEVMHVALSHLNGLKGKDTKVSNVAQDIVINDIILENQLQLPREGLLPSNHEITINGNIKIVKINKKPWEQVYHELEKKLPKEKVYGFDEHMRDKGKDDQDGKGGAAGDDKDWKQIINEGYAYAKLQGKAPAGVDRYIEELSYPKLNWRQMLQKFIVREIPYDFCYTRPSRKSLATGVFMPSVVRESLEIGVALDTSGSMSHKDLKECLSETLGIVKAYSNVKLTGLTCDAEVHTMAEVSSEEDIANLEIKGGGGTDFIPVFKWVEENKPQMRLLIFFTDGYGSFPESAPMVKTLWCITQGGMELDKIPFGERVNLDFRDKPEDEA
jgi:predicted metal-dependent peptidase